MTITKTNCVASDGVIFSNLFLLKSNAFIDERGTFAEIFNARDLQKIGINTQFVQDNISYSKMNALRGLHYQKVHAQEKLVRVIKGSVLDIVLDIRRDSKTYGKIFSIKLDSKDNYSLFIGAGFAHGFVSLCDDTIFYYKCSTYYDKTDEAGFQAKGIAQKLLNKNNQNDFIQSQKDLALPDFVLN